MEVSPAIPDQIIDLDRAASRIFATKLNLVQLRQGSGFKEPVIFNITQDESASGMIIRVQRASVIVMTDHMMEPQVSNGPVFFSQDASIRSTNRLKNIYFIKTGIRCGSKNDLGIVQKEIHLPAWQ